MAEKVGAGKGWSTYSGGGGAGNPGGAGSSATSSTGYAGSTGTGGLLVIYADTFTNQSTISSDGSKGGQGYAPGGASGGGSINIFYNHLKSNGNISAVGGARADKSSGENGKYPAAKSVGMAGGAGTVSFTQVIPDLNYDEKIIELNVGGTYQIDKSHLKYVARGDNAQIFGVGNITFEILDTSIASITPDGFITAISEGKTKVKITDETNNYETYIYLQVIEDIRVDIQEGSHLTVALKKNGTVWTYGYNNNGQLGIRK